MNALKNLNFSITGVPWIDAILMRIVMVIVPVIAGAAIEWLKDHGLAGQDVSMVVTMAAFAFVMVTVIMVVDWLKRRADLVKAVTAGINLALQGGVLDAGGRKIDTGGMGDVAIKPVTPTSAKEIVATYAGAK